MNNFKSSPGGLRGRKEFIGGRPKSDANYGPKKSFDKKPSFGGNGGFKKDFKGGDRGGSRGGFGGGDRGRGGFGGGRDNDRRPLEMHKATCANCGKPCEVPFRPDGSKPVLCSECFGMTKTDSRNGSDSRVRYGNDRSKPERSFEKPVRSSEDYSLLLKQISVLEEKLDAVIALVQASVIVAEEMVEEVTDTAEKPKKAVVKKTPVKKTAVKKVATKAAPKKIVAKKVAKKVKK